MVDFTSFRGMPSLSRAPWELLMSSRLAFCMGSILDDFEGIPPFDNAMRCAGGKPPRCHAGLETGRCGVEHNHGRKSNNLKIEIFEPANLKNNTVGR
jgi:hypothetical protein